ncbi:hypothetical protein, partial [Yersinia aldovae]|uniref:hypothetical protein n=1 Tax=Yersinia aldovae TaxID=29483 RepID=UPI001C97F9FC
GSCGFIEEGMNSLSFHDNSIFCNKPFRDIVANTFCEFKTLTADNGLPSESTILHAGILPSNTKTIVH